MKIIGKIGAALLLLIFMCTAVFAAGSIDLSKTASLTLYSRYDDTAISDITFRLYRVCSVDATGELTVTDAFSPYAEDLDIRGKNDEKWYAAAQKLEQEIMGSDGAMLPDISAVADENGMAHFSLLPLGLYLVLVDGCVQEGYVYSVSAFFVMLPEQQADTNTWNYTVTASPKLSKNPLLVDYEVLKIWKDNCHETQRPQSITVHLLCDGQIYDTVTLPQNGRWQYAWEKLDSNHKWSVTEEPIDGYAAASVEQNGYTFVITNTCNKPTTPDKPNLPQTGQLWWPVPVMLIGGLLLIFFGQLRRRGDGNG